MKVTLLNHCVDHIQVHKVGCADIARAEKKRLVNSKWDIDVPDGKTAAEAAVDDLNASFGWPESGEENPPWSESDIRVLPCVKR